jgi:hypothetical protein
MPASQLHSCGRDRSGYLRPSNMAPHLIISDALAHPPAYGISKGKALGQLAKR